ncbi:competence protein ComF [Clostridium oceanicum]|uniref:Competence protein ComF n=1 Tax=Clostridium oceanicum TaxID=1543 RepID=A0ABN1JPZ5_9CLOT
MTLLKKYGYEKHEPSEVLDYISSWCKSEERFLNVIAIPYNDCKFFVDIILYFINHGKNILYVTNEKKTNVKIVRYLKKLTGFNDYSYVKNPKTKVESKLKITDFNIGDYLNEKFDLVIYDDISNFSFHSKENIQRLIKSKLKNEGKAISYSIEPILPYYRHFYIPFREDKMPIIEPRIMITRIDLNKEIPFIMYDYLEWSIKSKRKVIVYTSSNRVSENLYKYINNNNINFGVSVTVDKNYKNYKKIDEFMKSEKGIIITNNFNNIPCNIKNTDLIVYGADSFNYKELVYLCGVVGRSEYNFRGEIMFLANSEEESMDKAKDIIRNFNKRAWKIGLLNL